MRHPRDIDAKGVEAFLTMLATQRRVSVSTHNQALSAILFLYREVLAVDLPWLNGIHRPARKPRIPSVLTQAEIAGLLAQMDNATFYAYGRRQRLQSGFPGLAITTTTSMN